MKLNLSEPILGYDGKPMPNTDGQGLVTWRSVITHALNNFEKDEHPTPEDKDKCFNLTVRAHIGNEVEYTVEECAFIQARIGRLYLPLVVGRAKEFLNRTSETNGAK